MAQLEQITQTLRFDAPDKCTEIFNGTIRAARGCDLRLRLGIFQKGNSLDLDNLSSVLFEIATAVKPDAARLVSKVITKAEFLATAIDKVAFAAGTAAHIQIDLSGAELNPSLANAASKNYFVILSGITAAGHRVPYGNGTFTIYEDGTADDAMPETETSYPTGLTSAQLQALTAYLLTQLPGGGAGGDPVDYTITHKVGGDAGALDAIDVSALALPLTKFYRVNGALKTSELKVDAVTAADGDLVVRPVGFHAVNNPRQWFSTL